MTWYFTATFYGIVHMFRIHDIFFPSMIDSILLEFKLSLICGSTFCTPMRLFLWLWKLENWSVSWRKAHLSCISVDITRIKALKIHLHEICYACFFFLIYSIASSWSDSYPGLFSNINSNSPEYSNSKVILYIIRIRKNKFFKMSS